MNREHWLTTVAQQLEPFFKRKKLFLKPYKVTCGWPVHRGIAVKQRVLGECHSYKTSKAGVAELFISPTLDEPLKVAGVVCHEMIHVAVGNECGHKGMFRTACKLLGMGGKPTSALPGRDLNKEVQKIIDGVGIYPHQAIEPIMKAVKKSANAPIKLVCDCGCFIRITPKWLEEVGHPTCACGGEFQEAD